MICLASNLHIKDLLIGYSKSWMEGIVPKLAKLILQLFSREIERIWY